MFDVDKWRRKAFRNAYRGYLLLTETQSTTDDPMLGTIRWQDAIGRDYLDMWSAHDCVLAQLFGTYSDGLEAMGLGSLEAERYGFNMPGGCGLLTEAWLYLLKTRG